MKICFIGDSHLASPMLAWRSDPQAFPSVDPTFLAAPGALMGSLKLDGHDLVAGHPELEGTMRMLGQPTRVDVRKFDAFAVVGLCFSLQTVDEMLYPDFRTPGPHLDPPKHVISEACFADAFEGLMRATLAVRTVSLVRAATDAPILVVPQPMPSDEILEGMRWRSMAARGDDFKLAHLFHACFGKVFPADVQVVAQPEQTLATPVTTQRCYAVGSERLDSTEGHPHGEWWHMNRAYGAIAMRTLLTTARDLLGPTAPAAGTIRRTRTAGAKGAVVSAAR